MNQSLLPFELGDRLFLVDASLIREVLGRVSWLPIPRASSQLPGVIAYNGTAIPFFDLPYCLGVSADPLSPSESEEDRSDDPARRRTLVGYLDGQYFAMSFDSAREVVHLPPSELLPVHALPTPFGTAEVSLEGSLATVLDLSQLVRDVTGSGRDALVV